MGTELEICIPKNVDFSFDKAEESIEKVFELFEDLEQIFSRFLERSELSILNKKREVIVSSDFSRVLQFAKNMAIETNGLFNPLISLSSIGYSTNFFDKKFEIITEKKSLNFNFKKIEINMKNNKVKLPENAFLDLGACAKGFAVDCAVLKMDKYFKNFLINAGGDLFARGNFHGKPWGVGISDPDDELEIFSVIDAENIAMATSGSYRRKWSVGDENFHHIVLGKNNETLKSDLKSVTVLAPTTMEADALATTAFLLGKEKGEQFLRKHNTIGYFI